MFFPLPMLEVLACVNKKLQYTVRQDLELPVDGCKVFSLK